MAKGDKNTASNMIKNETGRVNNQVGTVNSDFSNERGNAVNINQMERGNLYNKLDTKANDLYGGLNGDVIANLRGANIGYTNPGSGGGGSAGGAGGNGDNGKYSFDDPYAGYKAFSKGGGIDESKMRAGESTFRDLMNNGGFSPERTAQVDRSIAGLEGLGATGGLDANSINRFRGNGIYDEFGQTGGWSSQDKANYRARNNAGMRAQFGSMKNEAARRASMGGGSGNFAAAMAKAARQNAYGMGQANIEGELGLQDQVNQGRKWGAEGMTSSENALQSLRTKNMLEGNTQAGNMGIGLQSAINQGKNAGASGITGMEHGIQDLRTRNELAGLGGMTGITTAQKQLEEAAAGRAASAAAAEAARRDANERFIGQMQMQGNQNALSGMQDLYSSTPGLTSMYNKDLLSGMGLQSGANQNLIGSQLDLARMPGGFQSALNSIGSLMGGAGSLMGGLSGMGGMSSGGGMLGDGLGNNYSLPQSNPWMDSAGSNWNPVF